MFQFDATHELYAHMNINYVRLDELPPFDRWGEAVEPLARGDFFTTTGEVLLPEVDFSASTADRLDVWNRGGLDVPLRFAEIVWGDEAGGVHREFTPLSRDAGLRRRRVRASPPTPPAGRGRESRSGMWRATARSSTRRGGSEPRTLARSAML